MTTRPEFLVLPPADCHRILEWNHIGRLAFRNRGSVDIEPIGYVASGDWIFFRSAYGAKLEALAHDPFAAFQVDQIASATSWTSVVAHGTIYMLPPDGAPLERRAFTNAVLALRTSVPTAFTPDDPTPYRDVVYGLHIDRISGRMAQPAGVDRQGRTAQVVRRPPARRRTSNGF